MVDTIVIAGALGQKPRQGGHTWVLLQYLLGFRHLGWDVLFLDRLESDMCFDEVGRACRLEESFNLDYLLRVMKHFELQDSFSLLYRGECSAGLNRRQVLDRVGHSAMLLNVMGYLNDDEILGAAPHRVFLDIDPGFGQMWCDLGLHDPFRGHERFVTVGGNIGRSDCGIPSCGLKWITTLPPVFLPCWPAMPQARPVFTSVASWRGAYGTVEYRGKTYGQRVHEFRRFAGLPALTKQAFEIALDIHPAETYDLALLQDQDWSLVDPIVVAGDPVSYQAYIQNSRAEFMVAKNMYVQTESGWLSDRSACYLASGKPVLAQDTGLRGVVPTGRGLLTFSTLEEACQGVEEIIRDYPLHSNAARALAEEYFSSEKVLTRLLAALALE